MSDYSRKTVPIHTFSINMALFRGKVRSYKYSVKGYSTQVHYTEKRASSELGKSLRL